MARFNYRGKELEELKKLSNEELLNLLPSNARRSLKRGQVKKNPALFKKINKAIKELNDGEQKTSIRTHLRSLVLTPKMVGLTIHIHKGNEFRKVVVSEKMIGQYLGEYALTRKMVKHSSPGVGASRSSKFIPVK